MNKLFRQQRYVAHTLCHVDPTCPQKVKDGLAITPAEMNRMVKSGIPITPQNSASFIDGEASFDRELTLEARRGVDAIDAWEASQTAKKNILNAHKKDVATYGK